MEVNEVKTPVTSGECAILLDAIHSTQSNINTLIHDNMTSVRAEIKASADYTNLRIDALTQRMDTQNGNVTKLQKLSNDRQGVINDFRKLEKEMRDREKWFKKNLFYLIVGAVIFTLVVVIVYDVIGLQGVIDLAKGMK